MDYKKTGKLIKDLRIERGLTQKELAKKINVTEQAISKWERGVGCPDVSLLTLISEIFSVNINDILSGELVKNDFVGGNMKKTKYFVCTECESISLCTGGASVSCCGRKLEALEAKKALENQKLSIDQVEDEWFVSSERPMKKDNYISFVALATGDKLLVFKQYPEWNMQVRIPKKPHGKLLWYSQQDGLLYQLI